MSFQHGKRISHQIAKKKLYMFPPLIKKNIFDVATLNLLYITLVCPSLIYCITGWGNAFNVCLRNAITYQKLISRLNVWYQP